MRVHLLCWPGERGKLNIQDGQNSLVFAPHFKSLLQSINLISVRIFCMQLNRPLGNREGEREGRREKVGERKRKAIEVSFP